MSDILKGQISIFDLPKEQKEVKESNKPKIRLLKDMKDLRQDFLKGNVYEVWQEKPNNYLIYLDGTFYKSSENTRDFSHGMNR